MFQFDKSIKNGGVYGDKSKYFGSVNKVGIFNKMLNFLIKLNKAQLIE